MSPRNRYSLTFAVEVPAPTLSDAIERALRLFRPRVRDGLRQTATFAGSYRGSWFVMSHVTSPPAGRVDLKKRRRKLRT